MASSRLKRKIEVADEGQYGNLNESFVSIGTALPALTDHKKDKNEFKPVWDQEVYDEQGRQVGPLCSCLSRPCTRSPLALTDVGSTAPLRAGSQQVTTTRSARKKVRFYCENGGRCAAGSVLTHNRRQDGLRRLSSRPGPAEQHSRIGLWQTLQRSSWTRRQDFPSFRWQRATRADEKLLFRPTGSRRIGLVSDYRNQLVVRLFLSGATAAQGARIRSAAGPLWWHHAVRRRRCHQPTAIRSDSRFARATFVLEDRTEADAQDGMARRSRSRTACLV